MKIAPLVAMAATVFVVGCSTANKDTNPNDPDKAGTTIILGGTDKSQPWLRMTCKPVNGTFTFTVEGDHLVDAAIQLSAPGKGGSPTIGADGKLPPYTISGVKKEESVRFSYLLADGATRRVNLRGCTEQ